MGKIKLIFGAFSKSLILQLSIVFVLLIPTVSYAMPILDLDSDFQLHGAKGVVVDGFSYNVSFIDSSCKAIWVNCDKNKFLFKTADVALKASRALLDQVLLDLAPHLQFDSVPSAVAGIEHSPGGIYTPYLTNSKGVSVPPSAIYLASALNDENDAADRVGLPRKVSWDNNFINFPSVVFARWSVPSTTVPEPSAMLLMASGLIAFGAVRRKARR